MKIFQFWDKGLTSLSQKYTEKVRKCSFLARRHFKAELYHYIYIVIFGQHFSGLLSFWILNVLIAQRTFDIKSWAGQPSSPTLSLNTKRTGKRGQELRELSINFWSCYIKNTCFENFGNISRKHLWWAPVLI